MNLLHKITLCCAILSAPLYADWDPQIITLENQSSINALNDASFVNLKTQVKQELTNSWCSAEKTNLLMDLALLTRPQVCVEVGAFTGSSVLPMAATLKFLNSGKIYAIDAWSNAEAVKNLDNNDPNKAWWAQVDMQTVHTLFRNLIDKWALGNFCTEVHKSSELAASDIPSNIDFLHFDGNYSEESSLRDVQLYLPKVKSGGYVLLSNFFILVNKQQPKIKAFCELCDFCEIIASIEKDNAILLRKN